MGGSIGGYHPHASMPNSPGACGGAWTVLGGAGIAAGQRGVSFFYHAQSTKAMIPSEQTILESQIS